MKIRHVCGCGALGEWEDEKGAYANIKDGVSPHHDAKGRQRLIEVRADEWLALHAYCRTPEGLKANRPAQHGEQP